jgi:hypothetical protein
MVHQQMMRRLPLDRLHHPARRQVRGHTQQQMHVVRPDVPLQNLNVLTQTDFPNQIPKLGPTSPFNTGLRYFGINTK